MNNICLFGLGLAGLIYFSSKNNNLLMDKDSSEKNVSSDEIVFVDSKDQLEVIVNNLMSNKFMKV